MHLILFDYRFPYFYLVHGQNWWNYWFDFSKYKQTIHDISKKQTNKKTPQKQLCYRRHGGGVAFINSPFWVQSGIYCAHRCVCATHFIYKTVKSVQGPQHFWTTKGVICQRKRSETNCPPPVRLETSCFPSCKVSTMLLSISCHKRVEMTFLYWLLTTICFYLRTVEKWSP